MTISEDVRANGKQHSVKRASSAGPLTHDKERKFAPVLALEKQSPRLRALLVGINEYPVQPLEGCINDVLDLERYLRGLDGFIARDIKLLKDANASREEILSGVRWLVKDARAGDRLVFHFSGHGAQLPESNEPDGLSEVLCPVDFDWAQKRAIFSRDIQSALGDLPQGVELTLVFDSCFSGGMDRDLARRSARPRTLFPPAEAAAALSKLRRRGAKPLHVDLARYSALLLACAERETAADAVFDGRPNGAFSYMLLRTLSSHAHDKLNALLPRVEAELVPFGQHPAVRGPLARLGASLFELAANTAPSSGAGEPWWSQVEEAPGGGRPVVTPLKLDSKEFVDWHRSLTLKPGARRALPAIPPTVRKSPRKASARGAGSDWLHVDEALVPGQKLVSADGHCRLEFQGDGNLVLYADDKGQTFVRWASNTSGQPGATCIMQGDGNLVIYSDQGQALWASGTWQHPGAELVLQDDENLVLYRDGAAVWATNTWTLSTPLQYLHGYVNSRPQVDWNTCGSAAIATMLDFWNTIPFVNWKNRLDARDGKYHWVDGEAIDAVIAAGFGPDVIFGWGTTGGRIQAALNSFGLPSDVGYSGVFSSGWEQVWQRVQDHLAAGFPVPVMVDMGVIDPSWGIAAFHWPVAYRIAHGRVYLANAGGATPTIEEFLRAWQCPVLPLGFNHCAVFHQRASQANDRRSLDPALYLRIYDDLSAAFGGDIGRGIEHWNNNGIGEGRRGSLLLDPVDYVTRHQDLANAFGTDYRAAIDHFITYGIYEGRRSSLEFDASWYLSQNGDLINAFGSRNYCMALEHFLNDGLAEGRQSSADFNVSYYLSAHQDLVDAFGATNYPAAFEHWLHYGKNEGRRPIP